MNRAPLKTTPRPRRHRQQFAHRPAARTGLPQEPRQRSVRATGSAVGSTRQQDGARRDGRRQRDSEERQPPVDARDQPDHGHADDPGGGCAGQRPRDNATPRLRRAPRPGSADAAGDENGDTDPHRNLSKRKDDERRRGSTGDRSDANERCAGQQQGPQGNRPPERATSTATTSATGAGEHTQLTGNRGRDMEIACDIDEDRREDEHRGLAGEHGHEEHESRRAGNAQPCGCFRFRHSCDHGHANKGRASTHAPQ